MVGEVDFYRTREWRELRYVILRKQGFKCQACGANGKQTVLHVDHIKPRSKYPELELEEGNLQVLCEDCNLGKSNIFEDRHVAFDNLGIPEDHWREHLRNLDLAKDFDGWAAKAELSVDEKAKFIASIVKEIRVFELRVRAARLMRAVRGKMSLEKIEAIMGLQRKQRLLRSAHD